MGGRIVDGSSNDSPNGGIAVEGGTRRASFWRVLRFLAATAVVLVIVGVTVVNILAENELSPMMSRGLSISPTGAFLALPMTLFVAVMLDTFPETRWLANVVGVCSPEKTGPSR
jgi:predicted PurR-regulated permease PerM